MKQINKRNSERVLAYIKKARAIIDQELELKGDELFFIRYKHSGRLFERT